MTEYENEISQAPLQRAVERSRWDDVVVELSSHRRWRSRDHGNGGTAFFDEARPVVEMEAVPAAPPPAESSPVGVTSLWPAGILALLSSGLILGLYGALVVAIKALANVPVIYL